MSHTIAQRPHVQVPWLPFIAVLAVVAAAALVVTLTLASSPTTPVATGPHALGAAAASVGSAAVTGEMQAAAPSTELAPTLRTSHGPQPRESRQTPHAPRPSWGPRKR